MVDFACKSGVYMIRNQATGRCYIGSAVDMLRREREHFKMLAGGRHHSQRLQASFNKHGAHAFVFFPLAFVLEKSKLLAVEQGYIDSHMSANDKFGYNICRTAGSNLGRAWSEETRKKISAGLTGKKQSAETIAKRAAGQRGRKMPREGVEKSRLARTGIQRPDVAQWAPQRFAMFSAAQVAQIKLDRASGMTYRVIAARHGCSIGTAHFAANGTGAFYSAMRA